MKKYIGFIIPIICVVLLLCSCKPKIKQANGCVTYFKQDTMKVMVDGDENTFLTDGAKFPAGAVMVKDSVEIIYVKDKAQVVRLVPHKGRIIDTHVNTSKPVMTKPAPKGAKERAKKFLEIMTKK